MANLVMATWNVRTLLTPQKHSSVTDILFRNRVDIAFLQETHLESKDVQRAASRRYAVVAASSASSHRSDVMILIHRSFKVKILGSGGDDGGRYCYVLFELAGRKLACFSLYTPTPYTNSFFQTITSKILSFSDHELVIGMDANAFLDLVLDKSPPLVGRRAPPSSYEHFAPLKFLKCYASFAVPFPHFERCPVDSNVLSLECPQASHKVLLSYSF
uniref:Endonuclease/exonuclease/phosphatase domain-containing protein n=1 Tax=Paramormyrops kingsleyae TaxID=1676925 RepID=A0A3B3QWM6_9TELE